jgi:hypothetical protein
VHILQDLANCLELILNDPHIEVDRIKNRLDPSYNIVSTQVASVLVWKRRARKDLLGRVRASGASDAA